MRQGAGCQVEDDPINIWPPQTKIFSQLFKSEQDSKHLTFRNIFDKRADFKMFLIPFFSFILIVLFWRRRQNFANNSCMVIIYIHQYSVIKSNCNKLNLYFEAFTSEFSYFQVINLIRILGGFVLTPPWPCSSSLGAESDPLPG